MILYKSSLPRFALAFCSTARYNARSYCKNPSEEVEKLKEMELKRIAEKASIDEPPTSCCQSGCANCVFIAWAEALASKMEHSGPDILKKIMDNVEDPSLKAYLELELKIKGHNC